MARRRHVWLARIAVLAEEPRRWEAELAELRALHGPDVHALRLSYGRPGQPRPQVDLQVALDDVAALTGVRIEPEAVIDHISPWARPIASRVASSCG